MRLVAERELSILGVDNIHRVTTIAIGTAYLEDLVRRFLFVFFFLHMFQLLSQGCNGGLGMCKSVGR